VKALVESLSARLTEQYVHYLETFMVDLWSDNGFIEFRAGFSLRSDHILRDLTVKVPASSATSDAERMAVIAAVFEEIEAAIDDAVADNRVDAN
jgi:hypothetical protein